MKGWGYMKKRVIGLLLAACMAATPVLAVEVPEVRDRDMGITITGEHIVASEPAQNDDYVCTNSVQYDENGEKEAYWIYKYDADGFLFSKTFCDADGSVYYSVEYAYDEYDNLTEEVQIARDGSVNNIEEWIYDSRGNLLEWKKSDANNPYFWYTYEYDSQDNLVKETECNEKGVPFKWTEYTYNSDGYLTEQKETENGAVTYHSVFTYESDVSVWEYETYKGNFSRMIHHAFNESGQETVTTYCKEDGTPTETWEENIYDKNGNLIRHEIHYRETVTCRTEYEFDDQSRLIRQTDFENNGTVDGETRWEYDAQGNAVKEIHYKANGTILYSIKNTYKLIDDLTAVNIFPDVNEGDWFAPYVNYAYDNNLMVGTGINFNPNNQLTRAMFVQILYSAEGQPEMTKKPSFSDVKAGAWYYNAVAWAEQNHVASGVGGGKFNPNGKVTREQLATMLHNYANKPKADTAVLKTFPDAGQVSGWAVDSMAWAVSSGIITGSAQKNGKVILNPKGIATRAQAATILSKYFSE